ncbi:2-deoxyglucose-6-phosphate phosphatase [Aspergillus aculeatinus CBS 121060]|uniref:2-deoxyglucose-6-phosphate phosphatase n=1 Tax=Aspergillus aculeatinus CBS 121060 TaxID=1448322 RepID=A0ACD1H2V5_9EURO|nr:2-deoxyglucose-6-phosphate phosphatase [Aspergillus aculeatinus CBS 121060]RAH67927.1 2-deoxyglucose-6-phosphate phosphatase [Aspergillus aculeatinus CBS 121060]
MAQSFQPAGPSERHAFAGVLLDFDGTIIDSTEAIVENWKRVAAELGLDYRDILRASHGRRSIDVLNELDPSKANWEYVSAMEARIPLLSSTPAVEIAGARRLLEQLNRYSTPHAIVTSGSKALLDAWLTILQLPRVMKATTAEDVKMGKPDPEGYRIAKKQLLQHRSGEGEVLVMEDAPAGIVAGKAAGCKVLAVTTTHTVQQLKEAGADWVVRDHRFVGFEAPAGSGDVCLTFHDLL